jgi:hypothetical protein
MQEGKVEGLLATHLSILGGENNFPSDTSLSKSRLHVHMIAAKMAGKARFNCLKVFTWVELGGR